MIIASESRIISSYKEALRIRQVFEELSLCRGIEKRQFSHIRFIQNEWRFLFISKLTVALDVTFMFQFWLY